MKTCKKCGKPLPDSYRSKLCESCIGKRAQVLKNSGKAVLSVAVMVGGTVVAIATKGKINLHIPLSECGSTAEFEHVFRTS